MLVLYTRWKKHNEFQLTKNKMDLNNRIMINYPPSPDYNYVTILILYILNMINIINHIRSRERNQYSIKHCQIQMIQS